MMQFLHSLAVLTSAVTASRLRHPTVTAAAQLLGRNAPRVCDIGLTTCADNHGCCPSGQSCTISGDIPICKAGCSNRDQCTWGTVTACCDQPGHRCDYVHGITGQCTPDTAGGSKVQPTATCSAEPAWPSHVVPSTGFTDATVTRCTETLKSATTSSAPQSKSQTTSIAQSTTVAGTAPRGTGATSVWETLGYVVLTIVGTIL